MASTSEQSSTSVRDLLVGLPSGPNRSPRASGKPSSLTRWTGWFVFVLVMAALGLGGWFAATSLGTHAGPDVLTHTVRNGKLVVTVTEDGNLESAVNIDVKCEVAGGSVILWIIPDGSDVTKGDLLVKLDSSALEDQINQQKITFEQARSTKVQSEKDFAVAKLSVQEYLDGTYVQSWQDLKAKHTIALENLRASENALEHTLKMFRKGYVSPLQKESQQFAVQKAKLDVDFAQTSLDVLEKFTKVKTVEDLQSKVTTAEAKMLSDRAALLLEETKLGRLETQLTKCEIRAPQEGMVVYANERSSSSRGSSSGVNIEEGASVRERQTLIRLPDLNQMQVRALVHESRVKNIRAGMRARVRVLGKEFQGTVVSLANQPEPTSFFSPSVKEYAAKVKIDGSPEGLIPGLTAEVEILVTHYEDVLTVPVASVVELNSKFYCWVRDGKELSRRPVVLGDSNEEFTILKDGVKAGDLVLLNPRAMIEEAREDEAVQKGVDVEKTFGKAPAETASGPASGPPSGPPDPSGPGLGAKGPSGPGDAPKSGGPRGNLMQYDANKDGKVSRDEAPEQMQGFFDRMDGNSDGFIDAAELKALKSRMQSGSGPGGPGPGGPGGP